MIQLILEPSLSEIENLSYIAEDVDKALAEYKLTENHMKDFHDKVEKRVIEKDGHKIKLIINEEEKYPSNMIELFVKMYFDDDKEDKVFSILYDKTINNKYQIFSLIYIIARLYLDDRIYAKYVSELQHNLELLIGM